MDHPPLLQTVESWIWPLSLAKFREDYWFQRSLVQHHGQASLGAYADIVPRDVDTSDWFHSLGGYSHVPIIKDGRLFETASVRSREAAKFYEAGHTVYVTNPEALIPSTLNFARTLDLPTSHLECNIYASKRGSHTPLHFDASESFVIQLRGTKVWRLAENKVAELPLTHWGPGVPVPTSLQECMPGELPTTDIATYEVVATPGTVLYLPRGYWHATSTSDDSISAHVHYRTVAWSDLAQFAIHRALARHREWRKPAFGMGSDVAERRRAVTELRPLLARLVNDIAGLDVSDLIGPTDEPPPTRDGEDSIKYRRVGLASVGVQSTDSDGFSVMHFTVARPLQKVTSEVEMPRSFATACLWACMQPLTRQFGVEELISTGLSQPEAREILFKLSSLGVIERAHEGR